MTTRTHTHTRTHTRTRLGRFTVLATAAVASLGVAAATAVPAGAAAAPKFLSANQLPPHPTSPWYAGPVTSGVPDPVPFCYGEALPGATSQHREFWTEYDTTARQVTVVERNVVRAKTLAALLRTAVKTCADRTEAQDPDATAEWKDYGKVAVEEGANVYGVHVGHSWGSSDIHLFSVGRDGRTVTVVHWGQMGDFQHAQVADFKKTTRKAVNKLY